MAYQQHQQIPFDITSENMDELSYADQPMAYHGNSRSIQSSRSPVASVSQMVSQGHHHRKDSHANSAGVPTPSSGLSPWAPKVAVSHPVPDWENLMPGHGVYQFDHNDPSYSQGAFLPEQMHPNGAHFQHPVVSHHSSPFPANASLHHHQSPTSFPQLRPDQIPGYGQQTQASVSPFSANASLEHHPSPTSFPQLRPDDNPGYGQQMQSSMSPFPADASLDRHQSPTSFPQIRPDQNHGHGQQMQSPMSPDSNGEWEATPEKEGSMFPTHMSTASPAKKTEKQRRGDGVRKKNAKIAIPRGRTVSIIEQMILKTTDEAELKELKLQKRLLRNREAALSSRQRKKKHTEDIEEKLEGANKAFREMAAERDHFARACEVANMHKQSLEQRLHAADFEISRLRHEKENMIVEHTQVTTNLRQKIHFLEESINSPAPAMSAAPSSAGFNELSCDMANFGISGEWDLNTFQPTTDWNGIGGSDATIQPSKLLLNAAQPEVLKTEEADQHISTGVLFVLLLCGAFVVANPSGTVPVIPRMSDEIREASTAVLTNLLQEVNTDDGVVARPFSLDHSSELSGPLASWPSNNSENSAMTSLHSRLTTPSKRQLAEQAAMMTPEQYNSFTESVQYPEPSAIDRPGRRNLAEILSNLRQERITNGGQADLYTRSLLWNQVPDNVVKQFKQAIQDNNNEQSATPSDANSSEEPEELEELEEPEEPEEFADLRAGLDNFHQQQGYDQQYWPTTTL